MLDNVLSMFDDRKALVGKIKKAAYETNMPIYCEKYADLYKEMLGYLSDRDDKAVAAKEIADIFCQRVYDGHAKNGRVKSGLILDLNFMMVYYFFPGLLLTGDENAATLADAIRDKWNETFGCTISYGTYDFIMEGFKKKLFGLW